MFIGNGYTTEKTVQLYVLFRASELTNKLGFNYFEILEADTDFSSYTISNPDKVEIQANPYGGYSGNIQKGTTTKISKYSANLTIKLHSTKPETNKNNVINAHEFLELNSWKIKL
ncbi:hypothetical protein CH366_19260 [Leptospira harrisiae]|nr:hypothetical protein CH366_19260 [Leptospira harrisiae]